MSRRKQLAIVSIPVIALAWYWFRPERLFTNTVAADVFVERSAVQLAVGKFHSVAHETRGDATIYELPNGTRVLRLTDFQTSNGPDVRVLLIAASDATDNATVTASHPIELAPLRGNLGDQNYDIPAGIDLTTPHAAVIWCHRFSVNFGAAPLH